MATDDDKLEEAEEASIESTSEDQKPRIFQHGWRRPATHGWWVFTFWIALLMTLIGGGCFFWVFFFDHEHGREKDLLASGVLFGLGVLYLIPSILNLRKAD